MRIVSGKFRGRKLVDFDHFRLLRPTTDKNREALFNILFFGKFIKEIGFSLADAEVLDVCCGTGAIGFEALSRGAKSCTFIENNRSHIELVKKNSELLHLENQVKILSLDAKKLPKNEKFFDFIFIDPPYKQDYSEVIKSLLDNHWIQKKSLVVVESEAGQNPESLEFDGLELLAARDCGRTVFTFFLTK